MPKRKRQMLVTSAAMLAALSSEAFAGDITPIPQVPSSAIAVSDGRPLVAVRPEAHPGERHWRQQHHWNRTARITHLEAAEHRLRVRAGKLQSEGQEAHANTLMARAAKLKQLLVRLRATEYASHQT